MNLSGKIGGVKAAMLRGVVRENVVWDDIYYMCVCDQEIQRALPVITMMGS